METHIQSVEDALIDSLSFKLPNSANFINERKSVTFFPTGGNNFTPQGVKIIKFMLAGTNWLDPSTVKMQFRLRNTAPVGPANLQPISALPALMFRRLRILAGGQVIEDIDMYNRVYHMVHNLLPAERRFNDYVEGFGVDYDRGDPLREMTHINQGTGPPPIIPFGGNRIVLFPLLCGLFNQTKFLPLRYLQGLQIELEVVNTFGEVVLTDNAVIQNNWTDQWEITEPQIKCDVITLDNQLDNEYTDHLMQGKGLPINFSSFVHSMQSVGATDKPVITMSRSFTRLKTVFVTFYRTPIIYFWNVATGTYDPIPGAVATHLPFREATFFYHPQYLYPSDHNADTMNGQAYERGYYVFQWNSEVEMQMQVGAKMFPEIPIRSSAEAYYHLRKSLGSHKPNSSYAVNILDREYRSHKFIVAFDTEKQTNAGFSGLNTRAGDLITIKCNNLHHISNADNGVPMPDTIPEFMHTTLEYDAIINITDAGVTVLE